MLKLRAAAGVIMSALTFSAAASVSGKPNILIMMADDLGWADVGFNGSAIETPSLDRLAAEGVKLDRFYVAPTCSPTRAGLMTGRDPMRLGIAYATVMPWANNGVNPDETMMPESFKASGYQTAMFGKWHLGVAQESYTPNQRGFDYFYGHLNTEVNYFPPYDTQGGKDFQRNGVSVDEKDYETYLLAEDAKRWIKNRDKSKPFFIYMPFLAPHTPLQAPADLIEKYKELNDNTEKSRSRGDTTRMISKITLQEKARPVYAAMVDAMDQAIGRVLQTLEEEGVADNTIVMFFSDNGGPVYGGAGAYNYPLRGGKGDTFEGGIRVVSAIRWPGRFPANSRMDSIMTMMDVFPTLAAAADIDPANHRNFDGRNMLAAIAGKQPVTRNDYQFFVAESPVRNSFSFTAFNDDWKLVQEVNQGLLSSDVTNYLFNISKDPYEKNNLANKHPDRVTAMSKAIHDWRMLHPLNGARSNIIPPPGWKAPKDWADYPIPMDRLQDKPARGMPPESAKVVLDMIYGEAGRLIYDCTPNPWLFGLCRENK